MSFLRVAARVVVPVAPAILAACGGTTESVTCGAGTHVEGTMCVAGAVDAGGDTRKPTGASDGGGSGGRDGGKPGEKDAAKGRDAGIDATVTGSDGAGGDGGMRDGGVGMDAMDAGRDVAMVSVPVSCAALNGCIADGGFPGPIDAGTLSCEGPGGGERDEEGDHSAWVKLAIDISCGNGASMFLESPSSALFDMDVYAAPLNECGYPNDCDLSACPALVGSARATRYDSGRAYVSISVPAPGGAFVHVIAQADAGCASGQTWKLQYFDN